MKSRFWFLVVLSAILILGGCRIKPVDYSSPLGPGEIALARITEPTEMPDLTMACYELDRLRETVNNSLHYLGKPSSKQFFPAAGISHRRVKASLETFAELLDSGLVGKPLASEIYKRFDIYTSVGYDSKGAVLFTGYYTPIFNGSMVSAEKFRYPLYKQPADLVKGPNGQILGRRLQNGTTTRYPSRIRIEQSRMLEGNELIWLGNPFEVYIAHVQGSARIRLGDGSLISVGYAASNGLQYRAVSRSRTAEKLGLKDKSLTELIDHFANHSQEVLEYTGVNPRYVFFQMVDSSPHGSINEPVIATRSIATDKSIFPRASLAFVTAKLPRLIGGKIAKVSHSRFVLDQDTGGAIRAPGRCDIYMGQGDLAGQMAEKIYNQGRLYYLLVKPEFAKAGN